MKELSIFVDESGDFGAYEPHAPFYLFTLVFHDQNNSRIIVYYDNGQVELNKVLASVFTVMLPQSEFRKVIPADYRLFQVADLFCTLELICLKNQRHIMSKSEEAFFGSMRDMQKNYLKPMYKKRYNPHT